MSSATPDARDCRPGRAGARWWILALCLCGLIALGIFGYAQQRLHGDVVTGLRTIGQGGAGWGLYIVLDITFVGLAAGGIVFMAAVRLFGLRDMRPLTRMAQVMTLASLGMAGMCVVADLGRPLQGLMHFPRHARTMSPFFGTFTLVACTGLVATFIYLWLDSRADAAACAARSGPLRPLHRLWAAGWRGTAAEHWRHRQASFWLALVLLPFMVIGVSTLGFVFGIQSARPGWFGTLQAPGFVVLGLISSLGILVLLAAAARRGPGLRDAIPDDCFRRLGNVMWILATVYLYIVVIEKLTAGYAASRAETNVAMSTLVGPWAPVFWTAVAGFALPALALFVQFVRRRTSVALTVICALVLNVAAILARFCIVVPSQTDGLLLPYPRGDYAPSWVELSVAGALFSLGLLSWLVFARVIPIVPLPIRPLGEPVTHAGTQDRPRTYRLMLTGATLLLGGTLAVSGFLLSARLGTEGWRDPLVPFSPILFITGMVIMFSSAVVYEVLPDRAVVPSPAAPADDGEITSTSPTGS